MGHKKPFWRTTFANKILQEDAERNKALKKQPYYDVSPIIPGSKPTYNVGPPSDVCWFINPINYSYKYHKP